MDGKLVLEKKKDKIIAKIQAGLMPFSCPDLNLKDLNLNGQSVDFERDDKNQVIYICVKQDKKTLLDLRSERKAVPVDNKVIQNTKKSDPKAPLFNRHTNKISSPARAPYNFVPLNEIVVPTKTEFVKIKGTETEVACTHNAFHPDRFSGHIELDIETKTPVYIRDFLSQQDLETASASKSKFTFCQINGKAMLPGSSLRGLIRQMVEMVSFGKFTQFDDRRLYYRAMADSCEDLKKIYMDTMVSEEPERNGRPGLTQYHMSAGLLIKDGFNYYIQPSKNFNKIPEFEARKLIPVGERYEEFRFYKLDDKKQYLIVSGKAPMRKKNAKKKQWLIDFPDNKIPGIDISEEDIENYKEDKNKTTANKVPDLIKLADKNKEGVPCFYTRWKDQLGEFHITFGHTAMFRLAYEKTIAEHIPNILTSNNPTTDFAEAIFGRSENDKQKALVGRVQFEDAYFSGDQAIEFEKEASAKILSSPKPTTFQHYLVQETAEPKKRSHYNNGTTLRGYKQYWHQKGGDWQEPPYSKSLQDDKGKSLDKQQHTKIKPVKANQKFSGKIHFENLTSEELGALLFALDLPAGHYHKIGMGKPLGLGSIYIKPTLFLSSRKNRYSDLFAEWGGLKESEQLNEFKNSFAAHVLKYLGKFGQASDLWCQDRLHELSTMLKFEHGINALSYMQIEKPDPSEKSGKRNEYKSRPVLPKPSDVR